MPHRGRFPVACLVAQSIFLLSLVNDRPGTVFGQDEDASAKTARSRPVILLTGFEPFGPKKTANPSWEGIRSLDGTKWKEFDLVAKEMPVVWGSPRELLSKWIAEYQPVAVLSFGQGDRAGFAVESVANNKRGRDRDNEGKIASSPEVVDKGPTKLIATIDARHMAERLSMAGFPTKVSRDAGGYLCEETLYCLEFLRRGGGDQMSVMFCHIPPIGAKIGSNTVDAKYAQNFVTAVLGEWRSMTLEAKSDLAAAEALIRRYFKVWSDQDMKEYGNCFSKHASIHAINDDGSISLSPLRPFVDGQTRAHKNATSRMVEVPEEITIRREGRLMRVVVYWKLTAENRVSVGYDHFTLCKESGQWKILNLVFYGTD